MSLSIHEISTVHEKEFMSHAGQTATSPTLNLSKVSNTSITHIDEISLEEKPIDKGPKTLVCQLFDEVISPYVDSKEQCKRYNKVISALVKDGHFPQFSEESKDVRVLKDRLSCLLQIEDMQTLEKTLDGLLQVDSTELRNSLKSFIAKEKLGTISKSGIIRKERKFVLSEEKRQQIDAAKLVKETLHKVSTTKLTVPSSVTPQVVDTEACDLSDNRTVSAHEVPSSQVYLSSPTIDHKKVSKPLAERRVSTMPSIAVVDEVAESTPSNELNDTVLVRLRDSLLEYARVKGSHQEKLLKSFKAYGLAAQGDKADALERRISELQIRDTSNLCRVLNALLQGHKANKSFATKIMQFISANHLGTHLNMFMVSKELRVSLKPLTHFGSSSADATHTQAVTTNNSVLVGQVNGHDIALNFNTLATMLKEELRAYLGGANAAERKQKIFAALTLPGVQETMGGDVNSLLDKLTISDVEHLQTVFNALLWKHNASSELAIRIKRLVQEHPLSEVFSLDEQGRVMLTMDKTKLGKKGLVVKFKPEFKLASLSNADTTVGVEKNQQLLAALNDYYQSKSHQEKFDSDLSAIPVLQQFIKTKRIVTEDGPRTKLAWVDGVGPKNNADLEAIFNCFRERHQEKGTLLKSVRKVYAAQFPEVKIPEANSASKPTWWESIKQGMRTRFTAFTLGGSLALGGVGLGALGVASSGVLAPMIVAIAGPVLIGVAVVGVLVVAGMAVKKYASVVSEQPWFKRLSALLS